MRVLYCPQSQNEMFEVPGYEGLWTSSSTRKIWIENFESDFSLKGFKKLKFQCPTCESSLSSAKDERNVEKFITCEECLGIQLDIKQIHILQDKELEKAIQKNLKKKPKKKKPKANPKKRETDEQEDKDDESNSEESAFAQSSAVMKFYLLYLIILGLTATVITLMPENFVPDLLGKRIVLNFVKVPFLEDFPIAITGILVIFPTFFLTLKEMKIVKFLSYIYFIILHLYLLWSLYPLIGQYIKL